MKTYYSRVDRWIVALIVGSILFCIVLGIYLLSIDTRAALMLFGIVASCIIVVLLLVIPCKYTMLDDQLLVQSGVIRYKIPYSDILKVEKSSNPLSSPALSLKRIKISRKKGYLLVSPLNRDQFIQDLLSRMS